MMSGAARQAPVLATPRRSGRGCVGGGRDRGGPVRARSTMTGSGAHPPSRRRWTRSWRSPPAERRRAAAGHRRHDRAALNRPRVHVGGLVRVERPVPTTAGVVAAAARGPGGPALMVVDRPRQGAPTPGVALDERRRRWTRAGEDSRASAPCASSSQAPARTCATRRGPAGGPGPGRSPRRGRQVHTSGDGGKTLCWPRPPSRVIDVEVDPTSPARAFFLLADHTLVRSDDQGANLQAAQRTRGQLVRHRRLELPGGRSTVVLAGAASAEANIDDIRLSLDSGESFVPRSLGDRRPRPARRHDLRARPRPAVRRRGSSSTAFRGPALRVYNNEGDRWDSVDTPRLRSIRDGIHAQSPAPGSQAVTGRAMFFRRDSAVGEEADLSRATTRRRQETRDPVEARDTRCQEKPYEPAQASRTPPAQFGPSQLALQLQPGVAAQQKIDVNAPARAVPAGRVLPVDTSTSMDPAIEAVYCSVQRIQRDLADNSTDTWFGLGAYNDIEEYRYRRLVKMQPPGRGAARRAEEPLHRPRQGRADAHGALPERDRRGHVLAHGDRGQPGVPGRPHRRRPTRRPSSARRRSRRSCSSPTSPTPRTSRRARRATSRCARRSSAR